MSTSVSQRALIIIENLWIGELVIQQRKVDETKHAWDLCFNGLLPGPARTKYYQDLLYSQGYGARLSQGDRRRRTRERKRFTEERRISYARELHVYRRLQVEIRSIREALEASRQ